MRDKPFDTVSIVIIVLLTGSEGVAKLIGDLVAPTGVGLAVAILVEVYTVIIWAIIIFWFVMKLGAFGAIGMYVTVGGLLSLAEIPFSLIAAALIGIYLANHPKAAAVAAVATAKPGAAAGEMAAGEAAATAEKITGAMETEVAAGKAGALGEAAAAETAAAGGAAAEKGVSEAQLGLEEEPGKVKEMERLREIMEKLPQPEQRGEKEDIDEAGGGEDVYGKAA